MDSAGGESAATGHFSDDRKLRFDVPGQLLAVIFLASVVYFVIARGRGRFGGRLSGACLVAAPVAPLLFILGIYLESVVGLSSFTAGLEILASSVAFILTSPLAGRIAGRIENRPLMVAGLLAIAFGMLLLTGVAPGEGPPRILVAMALSGVGMGLNTGPALNAAVGNGIGRAAGSGRQVRRTPPSCRPRDQPLHPGAVDSVGGKPL